MIRPRSILGQGAVLVLLLGILAALALNGNLDWIPRLMDCPPGQKAVTGWANGSYVYLCVPG